MLKKSNLKKNPRWWKATILKNVKCDITAAIRLIDEIWCDGAS